MTDEITITRYQGVPASGYDRVLAFMRDQLLSGRLKTGDRLLSERDLAGALGVSRPVVREALRALAAIGAVEVQRGQGTVVRKPDFTALADFFSFVLAQQRDAVDDVMEVRIAIERHAIRLACKRALANDIETVARAFQRIVETMDDPEAGGAADFHFHTTIVEAARSPTLSSVYAAIANLLQRSHLERREQIMNVEGIDTFLIDHHAAILKALEERDADRADTLLADHFQIGADFRRRANLLKPAAV
jgi:GntR family transcriptional repressor for pyruvate dehydrogenase complex